MAQMHSDTHIGEDLAAARVAKGLTHGDVAEALNLQADYIDAIERLNRDALPSIGYVLGYVRAYANLVGLDGSEAVKLFKRDSAVPVNLGMRDRPHFVPRRKIKLPRGFVPAMSVLGCAVMLAFWYGTNTRVEASVGTSIELSNPSAPAPSAPTPLPANILTIKAVAPSWVQVKDAQGRVVISRILTKGETYQTEAGARMTLSARDGGAIVLYAGEDRLGPMGDVGVSFSGKPIDASVIIPELADIPLVPLTTDRPQ
ncbi:helix-turn-helix domain-containing protein [Fretibacter rubidus]|uniref:helix-turn-helix domain-containing protein n=1 Tax=Fretibacter rubidus TaxID=570162 RepID=UPI00352A7B1F